VCDAGWFGRACNHSCPDCGGPSRGACNDGRAGNGNCTCTTKFAGPNCADCAPGFYTGTCALECGACGEHAECDDGRTGQGCVCKAGWARSTPSGACDECAPGFYGSTCQPCTAQCVHGSCASGVSANGACVCDEGYSGERCEDCATGFFGADCKGVCPTCEAPLVCLDGPRGSGLCGCPGGKSGAACDECAYGWTGVHCRECRPGFYGSSCVPCNCGIGDCDDGVAGTGACTCPHPSKGDHCQECEDGYWGPACTACACAAGTTCDDGARGFGDCVCDSGFSGVDCALQSVEAYSLASSNATLPPVLPGSQLLAAGYNVVTGAITARPVHAVGYKAGLTVTTRDTTYVCVRARGALWLVACSYDCACSLAPGVVCMCEVLSPSVTRVRGVGAGMHARRG